MSNQFLYNGYSDYGLNDYYPNNQSNFYQNDYRPVEQGYLASVPNGTWPLSVADQMNGVNMTESHRLAPEASGWVRTNVPSDPHSFNQWEPSFTDTPFVPNDRNRVGDRVRVNQGVGTWATGEGMPSWVHGRIYPVIETRTRNGVAELLLGEGINSWIRATDVTTVTETAPFRVGDRVRVNQGVRTWATGEGMPSWVHGRVYPIIEIRTRSGVTQLLLGEGINSWIRATDVTSATATPPSAPFRVGDRVRVNQGVRTWATGEGMPSWVHGRVYPIIEIRTRNGVTQLLLGEGINSWIRATDVMEATGTPPPSPAPIRVGDRVRVNQGVRTWATGEGMPSWVHGRVYPVIEIRTRSGVTQLLLGAGINSWIRQADVTRV